MKKGSVFIFFLLLAMSCLDSPDCFQLNNNIIGIGFGVIGSTRADSLHFKVVNVNDKVYYGPKIRTDTAQTSLLLPLDITGNESVVTFTTRDNQTRVLNLSYLKQMQYLSEDCGSRFILSDLQLGAKSDNAAFNFDSVRLVNGTPTKAGTINIEVLRCPTYRYVGINFTQRYTTTSTSGAVTNASQVRLVRFKSITDENGVVYYANVGRSTVYIPVDPAKAETKFTFKFADDFADHFSPDSTATLVIGYSVAAADAYAKCPGVRRITDLAIDPTANPFAFETPMKDSQQRNLVTIQDPPIVNFDIGRCPPLNLTQLAFKRYNLARTAKSSASVKIKKITAVYSGKVYYATDTTIAKSTVALPLDPNAGNTRFIIEYTQPGRANDEVFLSYDRGSVSAFPECGVQTNFTNLRKADDNPKIEMVENSAIVKYPAVTNVDVIIN